MEDKTRLINSEVSPPEGLPLFGKRHLLILLTFFGFFNVYALRVNMSVALVAMINHTAITSHNNNHVHHECPLPQGGSNGTSSDEDGEFAWDNDLQGLILGSFFYGYLITQIPGGWLSERFGGDRLFGLGVLTTSVLTLLTPVSARVSPYLLVAVRVLEGLGEAVTFPAVHALAARWSPPLERSRLLSFAWSGVQVGTMVSMPVSGLLCKYGFDGGWPSVFYIFGGVGVLWYAAWWYLTYPSPDEHPTISAAERDYIINSLEHTSSDSSRGVTPTPWLQFAKSPPFLALILTHTCLNWAFYTILTEIPNYLKTVLRFNISEDGFLSALPYLASFLVMVPAGVAADYVQSKQYLRVKYVRRIWNSIGMLGGAVCLVGVALVGCDEVAAVALLTLAVAIYGFIYSGSLVNHIELSPRHAGTLLGITNSFATIPGFLSPQITGVLLQANPTSHKHQWQIVFYIAAALQVLGALVFNLFSSQERQTHWYEEGEGARDRGKGPEITPINAAQLHGEIS